MARSKLENVQQPQAEEPQDDSWEEQEPEKFFQEAAPVHIEPVKVEKVENAREKRDDASVRRTEPRVSKGSIDTTHQNLNSMGRNRDTEF